MKYTLATLVVCTLVWLLPEKRKRHQVPRRPAALPSTTASGTTEAYQMFAILLAAIAAVLSIIASIGQIF